MFSLSRHTVFRIRSLRLVLAAATVAGSAGLGGCGGTTEPSMVTYVVTVMNDRVVPTTDGSYRRQVGVRVSDAANAPVIGARVYARSTAGIVAGQPLLADADGVATAVWVVTEAEQQASPSAALGFCSTSLHTSCQADLNSDQVVHATF